MNHIQHRPHSPASVNRSSSPLPLSPAPQRIPHGAAQIQNQQLQQQLSQSPAGSLTHTPGNNNIHTNQQSHSNRLSPLPPSSHHITSSTQSIPLSQPHQPSAPIPDLHTTGSSSFYPTIHNDSSQMSLPPPSYDETFQHQSL